MAKTAKKKDGSHATEDSGEQLNERPFDPKKISTYDFTDLYISENGEVSIKGLSSMQTEESDGMAWLDTEIPPEVTDMDALKSSLYEADEARDRNVDDVSFTFDFDETRYRVSVIDAVNGRWFTLRKINRPKRLRDFNGLTPILRRTILELGSNGSSKEETTPLTGLILVNGPTGSGKTTFSGAVLQDYLLKYGGVAVTVEDPPEIAFRPTYLDGKARVFQTEVIEGDFATACQNTMRYSPRYIFLGEIRDSKAAFQAVRAALNGHLVISTIHAGSIIEAIDTLIRLASGGVETSVVANMLAQGLRAVLDVRLFNQIGGGRKMTFNSLFIPPTSEGRNIASKISSGNAGGLNSEIERQNNLMKNARKMPVEWHERKKNSATEKEKDRGEKDS